MTTDILDLIDTRSFSSVWYWISVAVTWSLATHRPMGVPYDMVWRARREGDASRAALDDVAGALARRLLTAIAQGGVIAVALGSAALSALVLLGFVYGLELAQAVLLIVLPLALVAWLTVRTARRIAAGGEPARLLRRLRIVTQVIGLLAIFISAVWGMYVNLMTTVL